MVSVTPPKRRESLVNGQGYPSERFIRFLEEISNVFEGLPDQMTSINPITTIDAVDLATVIVLTNENKAKINELITEFKASGVMET